MSLNGRPLWLPVTFVPILCGSSAHLYRRMEPCFPPTHTHPFSIHEEIAPPSSQTVIFTSSLFPSKGTQLVL